MTRNFASYQNNSTVALVILSLCLGIFRCQKHHHFKGKLKRIQRLQNKEDRLKHHCEILSGQECNNILPLAQKIRALNIDIKELLVFDTAVNQIAKEYNLPPSVAAFRLIRDIKDYNKMGGLKSEISRLCQQLFVVNGICTDQNQALASLVKLQSHGITEDQINNNNSPVLLFAYYMKK